MHLIDSLKQSNNDIRILWFSVFIRMTSYGLTNQVLTLYLEELGVSQQNIGVFMTLTLVGDTIISYFLTWYADRIGRRVVMIIGTVMMFVSGLTFTFSSHFILLLIAATIGVISPSGDETGPFKSVEEASIAHLTPDNHRPEVFAFYGLFATVGAAVGSLSCGLLVDYLNLQLNYDIETCYRAVFLIYSIIGVLKFISMLFLSQKCEVNHARRDSFNLLSQEVDGNDSTEEDQIDEEDEQEDDEDAIEGVSFNFTGLSPTTRYYLPRLLIIFMLDSFGYGFMPSAWIIYYLKKTFQITASGLGTLFFITNSIDSITTLPSAWLAKLLGPVKAILFTQAPSAVIFFLIAYVSKFPIVAILLVLYYSVSTMDIVPRQILLTSIMPQDEITKVMGIVNIGKTFARCIGPVFTGRLAANQLLYVGFIINGVCTLVADIILGLNFLHLDQEILEKQSVVVNIE
ncbi:major facilitator superfamily domain-containing protein [Scheffersomyces coipomensis]|uniref:major facilitator superfamily domain-containing protein n=1 Tax=Scheffersomyces coipomensis TaxID=1788519 RepID=UPI00315DA3B4